MAVKKLRHHPDGPSVLRNKYVKKIKKVKLSLGLISQAPRHENVWRVEVLLHHLHMSNKVGNMCIPL
jgi:hypothetical protein